MSNIKILNLSKHYGGKKILNNLNLHIKDGSFFTFLGPSGCGKTTLLKSIAGIIDDYEGEILIDDLNIRSTPIENRNITFVFQDHLLFPNMTVFDNIAFGLSIKKKDKKFILEKVTSLLDLLDINDIKDKYPSELSGGQKQRVSIGRALAISPKILLMDEPFSSLDINLRDTMRSLIKKLHRTLNLTIVFVTHDKDEALTLSDNIAIINNGNILQIGTPYEIYECPKTLEVAKFFGHSNIVNGLIKDNHFINNIFNISLPVENSYIENNEYSLVIKPEDITISPTTSSNLVIKDKIYMGEKFIYKVETPTSDELKVVTSKHIDLPLAAPVSLTLNLKTSPNLF